MSRCKLALSAIGMILTTMVVGPALAAITCGEPVPAPKFQVGDTWTWRSEKGQESTDKVIQVDGDTTQILRSNGQIAFVDKDGILQQVRKKNGKVVRTQGAGAYTTIGKKVLDFPLQQGKKWEYSFTDSSASNLWGLQTYISLSFSAEPWPLFTKRLARLTVRDLQRCIDRLCGPQASWALALG
jgi:hypothetical protein